MLNALVAWAEQRWRVWIRKERTASASGEVAAGCERQIGHEVHWARQLARNLESFRRTMNAVMFCKDGDDDVVYFPIYSRLQTCLANVSYTTQIGAWLAESIEG